MIHPSHPPLRYKNLKAQVTDSSGKRYSASIRERDSDSLEIRVKGLSSGRNYTVQVTGVRIKGVGSYGTVTRTGVLREFSVRLPERSARCINRQSHALPRFPETHWARKSRKQYAF